MCTNNNTLAADITNIYLKKSDNHKTCIIISHFKNLQIPACVCTAPFYCFRTLHFVCFTKWFITKKHNVSPLVSRDARRVALFSYLVKIRKMNVVRFSFRLSTNRTSPQDQQHPKTILFAKFIWSFFFDLRTSTRFIVNIDWSSRRSRKMNIQLGYTRLRRLGMFFWWAVCMVLIIQQTMVIVSSTPNSRLISAGLIIAYFFERGKTNLK